MLAIFVAIAIVPSAAFAQESPIDQSKVVDPTATIQDVTPTPTPSATPGPTATPTSTPEPGSQAAVVEPGYGNAAEQPTVAQRKEAAHACKATRPPTSHLLGEGSVVSGTDSGSLVSLGIVIVIVAVAVAAAAALLRRRRATETSKQGPLERFSVVLAAGATVATLLLQVAPGIASEPPPEATLSVVKVHARIELADYARLVDVAPPAQALDRRRVGDVVWLEIGLKGFKNMALHLRYGLFDLDRAARGALLPGTANDVALHRPPHDGERQLVPVWVGYPKSNRFRAEFWLMTGNGVQAIASTGSMAGSTYRYAC